jgi:hypothetical protein
LDELGRVFELIDTLYSSEANAYSRINSFVHRVIEIHNSLILPGESIEAVSFRYVQANLILPYARLENTILPALVHEWPWRAPGNWDMFVQAIGFLSERYGYSDRIDEIPKVFVDDFDMNIRFRRISLDPALDFLGFTEPDFLLSLSNFWECPPGRTGLPACRAILSGTRDLPDDLDEGRFDRNSPLWALVWLLFFEDGEPPIVRTFDELVQMFVELTGLRLAAVKRRIEL